MGIAGPFCLKAIAAVLSSAPGHLGGGRLLEPLAPLGKLLPTWLFN